MSRHRVAFEEFLEGKDLLPPNVRALAKNLSKEEVVVVPERGILQEEQCKMLTPS